MIETFDTISLNNLTVSKTPPLKSGDRLSRVEFEQRYAGETYRAELIEGTVHMAAALRFKSHGQPHGQMMMWLMNYVTETEGTLAGDAPSVRLDEGNEPQPDLVLMIDPDCGGQTKLTDDDYIEGAPELLAEIAASTVAIDLGDKKTVYQRNGVQEYLVWRVLDQQIDWFYLKEKQYIELLADEDGITRSIVFPGLWLDRPALIEGNMKRVSAVLNLGIQSKAHHDFGVKLASKSIDLTAS